MARKFKTLRPQDIPTVESNENRNDDEAAEEILQKRQRRIEKAEESEGEPRNKPLPDRLQHSGEQYEKTPENERVHEASKRLTQYLRLCDRYDKRLFQTGHGIFEPAVRLAEAQVFDQSAHAE